MKLLNSVASYINQGDLHKVPKCSVPIFFTRAEKNCKWEAV